MGKLRSKPFVYFLKPVGMDGPIKIGCSMQPLVRLEGLMSWVPFELELLAMTPGGYPEERRIHFRFREHRLRCEWFTVAPEIMDFIEAVKARGELPFPIYTGRNSQMLLGLPGILKRHGLSYERFGELAAVTAPAVRAWVTVSGECAIGVVAEVLHNLGIPYPLEAIIDGPDLVNRRAYVKSGPQRKPYTRRRVPGVVQTRVSSGNTVASTRNGGV